MNIVLLSKLWSIIYCNVTFWCFQNSSIFFKEKKNLVKEFHPGLFKQDLSGENNIIFKNIDLQKA